MAILDLKLGVVVNFLLSFVITDLMSYNGFNKRASQKNNNLNAVLTSSKKNSVTLRKRGYTMIHHFISIVEYKLVIVLFVIICVLFSFRFYNSIARALNWLLRTQVSYWLSSGPYQSMPPYHEI